MPTEVPYEVAILQGGIHLPDAVVLPDHISYSQMDLFLKCPRQWWFRYIKYPNQRGSEDWPLDLGSAYHSAMEALYHGKTFAEAIEDYDDTFKTDLLDITAYKKKDYDLVIDNIAYYHDNILPMYKHLAAGVELKELLYIDGIDVPLELRVDLFTIDDRIIDHKTVGRMQPKAEMNKQLMIYSYWFYKKFGKMPRSVELHKCYKNNYGGQAPIEIEEYHLELTDVLKAVDELRMVYRHMKANDFNPSPSTFCNSCGFKDECDMMARMNG